MGRGPGDEHRGGCAQRHESRIRSMNSESLPVSGVCEIALEMSDLEAGERFYSGILGFPVVERWSARGGAIWVMAADRTRIGLWRPQLGLGGGRGGAPVHYAMPLPAPAYDAAVARPRRAGPEGLG